MKKRFYIKFLSIFCIVVCLCISLYLYSNHPYALIPQESSRYIPKITYLYFDDQEFTDQDKLDAITELLKQAAQETGKMVTVEEHSVIGGLGSAVCECLAECKNAEVLRIGVMDTFGESGPAKELLIKYGLDGKSIYEKVRKFVRK